jgi:hypothetical protein
VASTTARNPLRALRERIYRIPQILEGKHFMPARKNEVPPPAKAKPRPAKRKPDSAAPTPDVRDNQVQGRDGG